jgi:hypothetical protein
MLECTQLRGSKSFAGGGQQRTSESNKRPVIEMSRDFIVGALWLRRLFCRTKRSRDRDMKSEGREVEVTTQQCTVTVQVHKVFRVQR